MSVAIAVTQAAEHTMGVVVDCAFGHLVCALCFF